MLQCAAAGAATCGDLRPAAELGLRAECPAVIDGPGAFDPRALLELRCLPVAGCTAGCDWRSSAPAGARASCRAIADRSIVSCNEADIASARFSDILATSDHSRPSRHAATLACGLQTPKIHAEKLSWGLWSWYDSGSRSDSSTACAMLRAAVAPRGTKIQGDGVCGCRSRPNSALT